MYMCVFALKEQFYIKITESKLHGIAKRISF